MKNGYEVETIPNDNDDVIQDGFSIIARIIARDFMTKQALNGVCEDGGTNNEHLQNK